MKSKGEPANSLQWRLSELPIREFENKKPDIHCSCYISPDATIVGDVTLGENSSVWPGARIRGDFNNIVIGAKTNIQDNVVIHIGIDTPTYIGDRVTIGHGALIEGCTVGDDVMIGMGAVVLQGSIIEDWVIVAAGAVVPEGSFVSSGKIVAGVPARVIKNLGNEHRERIKEAAEAYINMNGRYRQLTSEE